MRVGAASSKRTTIVIGFSWHTADTVLDPARVGRNETSMTPPTGHKLHSQGCAWAAWIRPVKSSGQGSLSCGGADCGATGVGGSWNPQCRASRAWAAGCALGRRGFFYLTDRDWANHSAAPAARPSETFALLLEPLSCREILSTAHSPPCHPPSTSHLPKSRSLSSRCSWPPASRPAPSRRRPAT